MPFNRQETKVKARRNEDMRTQKADLLLMNVDFLDENWERVRGVILYRDGVIWRSANMETVKRFMKQMRR